MLFTLIETQSQTRLSLESANLRQGQNLNRSWSGFSD